MSLFGRSPESRRIGALRRAAPGPLRDYLAVPWPGPSTPISSLPILAVDIETTGLNSAGDDILAIGFVPVDGREIRLAGARRLVVRAERPVGSSAVIHRLTDDTIASGVPLADALAALLAALTGRVLLAHHALIETEFLAAASRRLWGLGMPCVRIDTMRLAERLFTRRLDAVVPAGALRLWAARERYGLPRARAHDALADALACAELYLAQTAELAAGTNEPITLRVIGS